MLTDQAGPSSDRITYESTSSVIATGLNVRPNEQVELGMSINWMSSSAGMDPFDLSAPSFTARVPLMPYDFSQTHLYSDIDVAGWDAGIEARFKMNDRIGLRGRYRYLDYADDAPYLYDTSGSNHVFGAALVWTF